MQQNSYIKIFHINFFHYIWLHYIDQNFVQFLIQHIDQMKKYKQIMQFQTQKTNQIRVGMIYQSSRSRQVMKIKRQLSQNKFNLNKSFYHSVNTQRISNNQNKYYKEKKEYVEIQKLADDEIQNSFIGFKVNNIKDKKQRSQSCQKIYENQFSKSQNDEWKKLKQKRKTRRQRFHMLYMYKNQTDLQNPERKQYNQIQQQTFNKSTPRFNDERKKIFPELKLKEVQTIKIKIKNKFQQDQTQNKQFYQNNKLTNIKGDLSQLNVKKEDSTSNIFQKFQINTTINQSFKIQNDKIQKQRTQIPCPYLPLKNKQLKFICEICQRSLSMDLQTRFFQCFHIFCRQCVQSYLLHKIQTFQEIQCPKQGCHNTYINKNSALYKSLPQDLKKKFKKIRHHFRVLKNPNLKLCPTQNCQGILKLTNQIFCPCLICKKQICRFCFLMKHQGSCLKNEVDYFQNVLHYRKCSKCNIIIQKTQDCNHMTCKCKHQFCYRCGINWVAAHNCLQPQNNRINRQNQIQRQRQRDKILRQRYISKAIKPTISLNGNMSLFDNYFHPKSFPPANIRNQIQNDRSDLPNQPRRTQISVTYVSKQILKIILYFLFFVLFLPIEMIIVGILVLIMTLTAALSIFIAGIFAGPIIFFKQLFCRQSVLSQILSIIFFPILIVLGMINGVVYFEKTAMPGMLEIDIKILNLISKTITFFRNLYIIRF